jgi:hypothetical protein
MNDDKTQPDPTDPRRRNHVSKHKKQKCQVRRPSWVSA